MLLVVGILPSGAAAPPENIVFTRLVDSATLIAGGSGTYGGFGAPSLSGGNLVFYGYNADRSQEGVYSIRQGSIRAVADSHNFALTSLISPQFENVVASGSTVAFGYQGFYPNSGFYRSVNGAVSPIVTQTTPVPGNSATFNAVVGSLSGNNAAFYGSYTVGSSVVGGIFSATPAGLNSVATTGSSIPGGSGSFTGFGVPAISGGNIAFRGFNGTEDGIYQSTAQGLESVANKSTPIPGGSGTFAAFGPPSISQSFIAFGAGYAGSGYAGIYLASHGAVSVVADLSTPVPGGRGTFSFIALQYVALSGNDVAFTGSDQDFRRGLYLDRDGVLMNIIESGDILDGRTVSSWDLQTTSLDGDQLAFSARFTDGSSALYLVQVPEPGSLALWIAGIALASIATRRSSNVSRKHARHSPH